jgi:hypothetical protein
MRVEMTKFFRRICSAVLPSLAILVSCATHAQAAERAGTVSFVIGAAQADQAGKTNQVIVRGGQVFAGQTIVTGANGHVHLTMVDGAAVIVRPSSRLKIEEYVYDALNPSKSRIKISLENGVVRSITGKAGEASKDSFRLNTPLAAIGIRGTDFVVQADQEITRVVVQSGAIVLSPLSADCLKEALGPCKNAQARTLTAAMRDAYLELRAKSEAAILVPAEKALESPNLISPPRSEEPKVNSDKSAKVGITQAENFVADANRAALPIKAKTDSSSTNSKPETNPATSPEVKPEPLTEFWWGRWEEYANGGNSTSSVRKDGREVVASNSVFGLYRKTNDEAVLPSSGVIGFKLADSESHILNPDKSLSVATIINPSLTVDFTNRRYDTSLTVQTGTFGNVDIQSKGSVTFQGYFINETNTPDTEIGGGLTTNGNQAGYVFQRLLSGGYFVVGATRWKRAP